jgi:hypothetical protein
MVTCLNRGINRFPSLALLLLAPLALLDAADAPNTPLQPALVVDKIAAKAVPFDLREVQLLDGPFKHAQDVNRQVLLQLNMDRMLHPLRREAGLPTSYKGVESYFFPAHRTPIRALSLRVRALLPQHGR